MGPVAWDFDGTLASRRGGWSGAVVAAIEREDPGASVSIEDIRPHLATGFPWHRPDDPHPETTDSETWWAQLQPVLQSAIAAQGYDRRVAAVIARSVRSIYLSESWTVYPDVSETLGALGEAGWDQVILSNHVPALPQLVDDLGLGEHFSAVYTSGRTGYEKPHPQAFEPVIEHGGDTEAWMIGDSVAADIEGANRVGLKAILVRNSHPSIDRQADGLPGVFEYLG